MSKARVIGYRKPTHKLANRQGGLSAIYQNGSNNLYPLYVEDSIAGSPTASRAHKMNTDYIVGELLGDDYIINQSKDLYVSTLLEDAGADISMQGGYFIHTNISWLDSNYKHVEPSILPYSHVRVNKEDDEGITSRYYVSEEFSVNKPISRKVNSMRYYYKFTKRKSAIIEQIKDYARKNDIEYTSDEGWLNAMRAFPGQVRYVKFTNEFPYTTSPVDAILVDAESEFYISKYTNEQTANGFISKTIIFVVEDEYEYPSEANSPADRYEEEQGDEMENWLGTDGSGGIFIQPMRNTDDPSKLIHVETLKGAFDDKMFEVTERRLRRNILGMFDNLPESLVFSGDGALFGQHPDLFKNLIQFYKDNTKKKRDFLYKTINDTLGIDLKYTE